MSLNGNDFDLVLPSAVDIREVGMREGLQVEASLPLADELAMPDALIAMGVRRVEATSFLSPRTVPDLEYVGSASDGHSRANAGRSTAEAVAAVGEIAGLAHGAGGTVEVIIATAWDCPSDGRTPVTRTAVGRHLPGSLYRAGGRSVPRVAEQAAAGS